MASPSTRWKNGSTRAWRKTRERILERDGNRCTHTWPSGRRCAKTDDLQVDHLKPGATLVEGIADEDLRTVCRKHNPTTDKSWTEATAVDAEARAIRGLELQELPLKKLRTAPWNANVVPHRTLERIENSIREFGIVENLVVRPNPGDPDNYEVLSGNHRLKLYKRLGLKTAPCAVVELEDGHAKVLAQALNRTRGVDDPEKLDNLMEQIFEALPAEEVERFLAEEIEVPRGDMAEALNYRNDDQNLEGYRFKPVNAVKLGMRLEACCHPRQTRAALELMAGQGQLSHWYGRIFERVVRVDQDAEGKPDHQMKAADYLRERFQEDGPFDLIDLDDEGSPHEELDVLFEVLKQFPQGPFVLCVTDGIANRIKMLRNHEVDLMALYRYPLVGKPHPRLYTRVPKLLDHGVQERAKEAGYEAELIAADWKPGHNAVYGSWTVGPLEDTRLPIEIETESAEEREQPPEAYGTWRVRLAADRDGDE